MQVVVTGLFSNICQSLSTWRSTCYEILSDRTICCWNLFGAFRQVEIFRSSYCYFRERNSWIPHSQLLDQQECFFERNKILLFVCVQIGAKTYDYLAFAIDYFKLRILLINNQTPPAKAGINELRKNGSGHANTQSSLALCSRTHAQNSSYFDLIQLCDGFYNPLGRLCLNELNLLKSTY